MPQADVTQRDIVLAAMRERPGDPWPRGQGHVVLGAPGSPRSQKAYHEPGGSFSPSPGSFGVSIWMRGGRTGDQLSLADVRQQYVWRRAGAVPALETATPHFDARWSLEADGVWQLELVPRDAATPLGLLIRSVGPAGGPVERLDWDGRQLVVNRRWVLAFAPAPARVQLGDEQARGWLTAECPMLSCESAAGWGYARVELAAVPFRMTIRDTAPQYAGSLPCAGVKSALALDLPDAAFVASLDAQAANLLMGFVGRQTCPGEPTNYPLAWERDGAYSVVAMARCGQAEAAKALAAYFAENDFFGGFGAEGDAPGSAINALVSVAAITGDADFRSWIWPHVRRKVDLIAEMLAARQPVRKTWVGPLIPSLRGRDDLGVICRPARDGLIVGAMDHHFPALYTTAMSYRGLRQAARLAATLGREADLKQAPEMAEGLRHAYRRSFADPELANERTFMSALWPTWIVEPGFEPLRAGLRARWEKVHGAGRYPQRPLWTYFTVAEAHQWLFLGQPDITWKTLDYFRANQSSPGLYTWWEGQGEENTFNLWPQIRGWVAPPHVTPHYWTAAEMLLLQIDMLAYVDEAAAEPVLVVGGGVPPGWVGRPMRVRGLPTSLGLVDWSSEGRTLRVTLRGRKCAVRPGPAFGPEVKVEVVQGS